MTVLVPFEEIVATCANVAALPRAKQRAAFAALALSQQDKTLALVDFAMRFFFQKKNGTPTDRLAWVYANAAIDKREVLPWTRGEVAHIVRASTPRPETFPPWIVAHAVEQFAASFGKPLPKEMRGWIGQTATALEQHGRDAATRDAVARLRAFSGVAPKAKAVTKSRAGTLAAARPRARSATKSRARRVS